jgi:excisionase family DNA binding protein
MATDEKPKLKMPPEVRFLSVPETALIMAVTNEQVRAWIQDGQLRAYRIGARNNLTRILCQDLEVFISQYTVDKRA